MKNNFKLNLVTVLAVFAIIAPTDFSWGSGRVGNGKQTTDAEGTKDVSLMGTPTPTPKPKPAAKAKPAAPAPTATPAKPKS